MQRTVGQGTVFCDFYDASVSDLEELGLVPALYSHIPTHHI